MNTSFSVKSLDKYFWAQINVQGIDNLRIQFQTIIKGMLK